MKKLNTKGFTLIELIAVIVILAVIILIASSAVGGTMDRAKKLALIQEGEHLVSAAEMAYTSDIASRTTVGSDTITQITPVCYTLSTLQTEGYFTKKGNESYNGSVLVVPNNGGITITYKYWISNGPLYIGAAGGEGETPGNQDPRIVQAITAGQTLNFNNCGGSSITGLVTRNAVS